MSIKPLPPDVLVEAKQDKIHKDIEGSRSAKTVRSITKGADMISERENQIFKDYVNTVKAENKYLKLEAKEDEELIDKLEAELAQCLDCCKRVGELEQQRDRLRQAIQNTIDTGMDRYIKEALEEL